MATLLTKARRVQAASVCYTGAATYPISIPYVRLSVSRRPASRPSRRRVSVRSGADPRRGSAPPPRTRRGDEGARPRPTRERLFPIAMVETALGTALVSSLGRLHGPATSGRPQGSEYRGGGDHRRFRGVERRDHAFDGGVCGSFLGGCRLGQGLPQQTPVFLGFRAVAGRHALGQSAAPARWRLPRARRLHWSGRRVHRSWGSAPSEAGDSADRGAAELGTGARRRQRVGQRQVWLPRGGW